MDRRIYVCVVLLLAGLLCIQAGEQQLQSVLGPVLTTAAAGTRRMTAVAVKRLLRDLADAYLRHELLAPFAKLQLALQLCTP
jgi:hypothetical protein